MYYLYILLKINTYFKIAIWTLFSTSDSWSNQDGLWLAKKSSSLLDPADLRQTYCTQISWLSADTPCFVCNSRWFLMQRLVWVLMSKRNRKNETTKSKTSNCNGLPPQWTTKFSPILCTDKLLWCMFLSISNPKLRRLAYFQKIILYIF